MSQPSNPEKKLTGNHYLDEVGITPEQVKDAAKKDSTLDRSLRDQEEEAQLPKAA